MGGILPRGAFGSCPVLPATLRHIATSLYLKRGVWASITSPPGDHLGPRKSPILPITLYPLPPGALGGMNFTCRWVLFRPAAMGPRGTFLTLEGPLRGDLRPRSVWQPEAAPTSTTHARWPACRCSSSSGYGSERSETQNSVARSLTFTRNTGAESGPGSRSRWFQGAPPQGVEGFHRIQRDKGLTWSMSGQLVAVARPPALGADPATHH